MKATDWFSELESQFNQDPDYLAEGIRLNFYEDILEHMEQQNISRAELARRLDCKPSYVSRIFNDSANVSVTSLVRIAFAVGCEMKINVAAKHASRQRNTTDETIEAISMKEKLINANEESENARFYYSYAA